MKISGLVLSLAIAAASVEAWSPSGLPSTSRDTMTMRVNTFDKVRRERLNGIFNEVKTSSVPKEVVKTKLVTDSISDMVAKCNWKLRKSLIRKVQTMAAEYEIEVDDKFGYRLTQEEREAAEQSAKAGNAVAKQAKADAVAAAEVERKAQKAAKTAEKKIEAEANIAKFKPVAAPAETTPEPVVEAASEPVVEAAPPAAAPAGGAITPKTIKALRDATGAGMMNCKKALLENDGDMEAATESLRKKGLAQADKKASRIAAEGKIAYATAGNKATLVEINCETDFVAKDGSFLAFTDAVAKAALDVEGDEISTLLETEVDGGDSIETARQALVAKIGENIQVRRSASLGGEGSTVGCYVHMNRIGVLVEIEGGTEGLAADIAMHVAAMNPPFANPEDVPQDVLEKEKAFLKTQALESGKPEEIVDKMVEGRIRKYLEEICLVSQTYVKTNDETVGSLLERNGAKMKGFTRIEVGEGIEKKEDDFAAEVAAMAGGN